MTRQERRNTTGRVLGAALVLLAAASCAKAPAELDPTGAAISFGAATDYPNYDRTRTEYSGYDENGAIVGSTSKFERIDWLADYDRVRILCAQARDVDGNLNPTGDYVIESPSPAGKVSQAGATPVTGTSPFYWVNGETYTFYALYPAPGTTSNYHEGTVSETDATIEPISGDRAKITGSIPASQAAVRKGTEDVFMPNMNFAYMYAQKRTSRTDDNYVKLDFYPLVTAMEFSLKALDDAMSLYDLESLKLSSTSTDMSGSFEATLDASASSPSIATTGTCGREITVTFPAGTKLKKGSYTKVTVLTLGVAQTDLTLRLSFSNGHSRKLLLKKTNGTLVTVGACKKAYFRLTVPSEEIFFEVTPMADFATPATLQPVTRGYDPIDNSSDVGLVAERNYYGVSAIRTAEGVSFAPADNPANWYVQNSAVSLMGEPSDYNLFTENTIWCGNPPLFWPSFDNLTFFAYAPYLANVQPVGTTEPQLRFPSEDYVAGMPRATYTPDRGVSRQVDLCLSKPAFDWNKTMGNVPFSFKHALTQVRLYVRVKGEPLPGGHFFRADAAVFSGLVASNTFTYVNDTDTPFVWDPVTDSTPREEGALYTLDYQSAHLVTNELPWYLPADLDDGTTTAQFLFINQTHNGRLYLIPQAITSMAKLQLNINLYRSSPVSLVSMLPPFIMNLPTATPWGAGQTVSYLITVDASRMVVLDIVAKVTPWADPGNDHDEQTIY